MTSYLPRYGELKMERVIKGRKGHRKSRSLVFRISRALLRAENGDSAPDSAEIAPICSEPTEQNAPLSSKSNRNEYGENFRGRIKQGSDGLLRTTGDNVRSSELRRSSRVMMLQLQKECSSDICLNKVTDEGDQTPFTSCASDKLANPIVTSSSNENRKLTFALRSKNKLMGSRGGRKRRGGRLARTRGFLMSRAGDENSDSSFATFSCNKLMARSGQKYEGKRRGGKTQRGSSVSSRGNRLYARRGRPAKVIPGHTSSPQDAISAFPPREENGSGKVPPNNSVWTLIPKGILQSDLFKSQVTKVIVFSSKQKVYKEPVSSAFPLGNEASDGQVSLAPIIPTPYASDETVQFKVPTSLKEVAPYWQQKLESGKNGKRPTVIYFSTGKKDFDDTQNRRKSFRSGHIKARNDLNYLFKKYQMFDAFTLNNLYASTNFNLNETENMLSVLLKNKMSSENRFSRSHFSSRLNLSGGSVDESAPYIDEIPNLDSSFELEIGDTLCRQVIVQSLRILFHEQAVLQ